MKEYFYAIEDVKYKIFYIFFISKDNVVYSCTCTYISFSSSISISTACMYVCMTYIFRLLKHQKICAIEVVAKKICIITFLNWGEDFNVVIFLCTYTYMYVHMYICMFSFFFFLLFFLSSVHWLWSSIIHTLYVYMCM